MKIDKISLNPKNKLQLELLKTSQEELELITPENLRKLNFNYTISQVFEPEHEIRETMQTFFFITFSLILIQFFQTGINSLDINIFIPLCLNVI